MQNIQLPLTGRNIVITRSKEKINHVKDLFQSNGAQIFDLPALIIDYPEDLRPLDQALSEIDNFHWIIFSSSNGIKFMERRLIERGSSLRKYTGLIKIAVVGEKTSQALDQLGISADFVPPNFVAESLIENFPTSAYGLRILLPRVQTGGRTILSENFRNAGARVEEVATYESKCPESMPQKTIFAFRDGIIDAMIFSSGKTVYNSSFLLEKYLGIEWKSILSEVHLLTIGPQTSIACKEVFGRVDKEAEKYTFEGLRDAAIDIFN